MAPLRRAADADPLARDVARGYPILDDSDLAFLLGKAAPDGTGRSGD